MQVIQSLLNPAHFNFSSSEPLYLQFAEKLKLLIISGAFSPGDRLPSVRDLALTAKLNPNTVQKSLSLLESEHLILTERTTGKFVTTDKDLLRSLRLSLAEQSATEFLLSMRTLGLSKKDTLALLTKLNEKLKG